MFYGYTLSVGDEEKVLDIGVMMLPQTNTHSQKAVCENIYFCIQK